jgi:hypothetical protein
MCFKPSKTRNRKRPLRAITAGFIAKSGCNFKIDNLEEFEKWQILANRM